MGFEIVGVHNHLQCNNELQKKIAFYIREIEIPTERILF